MVHPSGRSPFSFPEGEQEMPGVLLPARSLPGLPVGHVPHSMDGLLLLCLPTISSRPPSSDQNVQGQSPPYPDRSGLAEAALVYHAALPVSVRPDSPATLPRPDHAGLRQATPPGPAVPSSDCMAAELPLLPDKLPHSLHLF
uniref:Uncharacterized protein n=1 Tax=Gopherus agassizii TaxID=38772 RepID=A0A452GFG8_9SAUR